MVFGYLISYIFNFNDAKRKLAICGTGFSHTTSIQLILVASLADILSDISADYKTNSDLSSYERGIYYVVLSGAVATTWNWTFAYRYS